MNATSQKLSVREKVGYSLGDLSANLVFQTLMMFLLVFYTDVFGISAAAAATWPTACPAAGWKARPTACSRGSCCAPSWRWA